MAIELEEVLKTGILRKGHFIGKSDMHLRHYLAKNRLFERPALMERIAASLAELAQVQNPDVVVGPAVGGAILAHLVAQKLPHYSFNREEEVLSAFCEWEKERQIFQRGYDSIIVGKKVVVVDDVVTSGLTLHETVQAVARAGGIVELVLSIFNRNASDKEVEKKLQTPYQSLFTLPLEAYHPDAVPPELAKIPIDTEYGHGRK